MTRPALCGALMLALLLGACGSEPPPPLEATRVARNEAGASISPTAPAASPAPASSTPAAESTATAVAATPTVVSAATPAAAVPGPAQPSQITVVLDPGHGGDEIGAAANGMVEKDSNLDMALRVERLLTEQGLRVVLTRRTDARANTTAPGAAPVGFSAQRLDLQARIDLANAEGAAIFVSLHSNGSNSTAERGVESYYDSARPFSAESARLARLLLDGVAANLAQAGYAVADRGAKDDSCLRAFQGRCFPLFVLGPERVTTKEEVLRRGGNPEALGFPSGQDSIRSRATQMPSALIELLFISNPPDAALLRDEAARDALARGVAEGVLRFLRP